MFDDINNIGAKMCGLICWFTRYICDWNDIPSAQGRSETSENTANLNCVYGITCTCW